MIKAIGFPKLPWWNITLRHLAMASVVLMLFSCTSTESPPTNELKSAELAIQQAEQSRASEHAFSELQEARNKLKEARDAVSKERYEIARRLAMQSSTYAELAVAKTDLRKAQEVNNQMEKNLRVLREELNRNSGE